MAQITLDHVDKLYDNGFHAVHDLSLTITDGEFLVLVGPSGCGKSTALRMIAGLETISRGTLVIDGRVVNDVEPKDRDDRHGLPVLRLYPHMTVRENIAFPLKLNKVPKPEIKERVDEAARVLELTEWLDRRPGAPLGWPAPAGRDGSGDRAPAEGLPDGRAAVEPRRQAAGADPRRDLPTAAPARRDHGVRHPRPGGGDDDGRSRAVVLSRGSLQQVDSPQNLYDHPDNLFVATFIGSPQMNVLRGTLTIVDGGGAQIQLGSQTIDVPAPVVASTAGTRRVRRPRSGGRHPAVGCRGSRRLRRRRVLAEGPCGGA